LAFGMVARAVAVLLLAVPASRGYSCAENADCGGHGTCVAASGTCTCFEGWGSPTDNVHYRSSSCNRRKFGKPDCNLYCFSNFSHFIYPSLPRPHVYRGMSRGKGVGRRADEPNAGPRDSRVLKHGCV
jgi:hypothetical protein